LTWQLADSGGSLVKVDRFLRVHPEFRRSVERRCELQRQLGTYARSTIHDSVDDFDVTPDVISEFFLCYAKRSKEFFPQNLSRTGRTSSSLHLPPSMVIDYVHQLSSELRPTEHDAPLVIDADAVKTKPTPLHRFQAVPRSFKQWGGTNKKRTGRELDGRTWDCMPMRVSD